MKPRYTEKQGQYSFIHRYTKARGYPPSEPDLQRHFGVSAPTIHQMIVRLEALGLIEKIPNTARSIHILLPEDQMPAVAARAAGTTKAPYTAKQRQYLAFIQHYTKVHRYPPAESDI